jgi:exosortase C (VPDSG-CTERM-specific)
MSETGQLEERLRVCGAGCDRSTLVGRRRWIAVCASSLVAILYFEWLREWWEVSLSGDLHSHIVLIPLISAYLLYTERNGLQWRAKTSLPFGLALVVVGLGLGGAAVWFKRDLEVVDLVALKTGSFLFVILGLAFGLFGAEWFRSACFPLLFLIFMVPLPGILVIGLEWVLMSASALVAEWFLQIGGIPVFREGQYLEIPGILLVVAEECSGIRSTWVLFITSVIASHLFIRNLPSKAILIGAVIPLGVLRNALRIFVIGWLCVHHGPEMIDSWIHRRGGALFFAVSLVPLFFLTWLLRGSGDQRNQGILNR